MTRSQLHPLPAYFDRYINKTDDVDVATALETGLAELDLAPIGDWERIGDRVYMPGKWMVKDILQHLIDTERIFSYRATAFARGDANVPSYDEATYGHRAAAARRTLGDLHDELMALRRSTIHQFLSFTQEMLQCQGNGFKGPYAVHDIGFIIPGHQRWHFGIIKQRYLPLVGG
ncbi:MAG: DinB family protein [Flavobacteriales bacterium]